MSRAFELLSVFIGGPGGGNAVPVASEGDDLSDQQMQALAQESGLESAFLSAAGTAGMTGRLRYSVPTTR